ncbi:hypothetical protein ACFQI7_32695 [Paenibacillus allorhizosphaerae]|uniref:Radical SAM protein n=1 Tax=Paenibacillus allorhizosphaerae TaxID=2849866 RepID=A0ABM8VV29_9BACL|nr:hypothetical protein [Paenibacillus allorhizosphaerae]CAG7659180.1 hypothetical protein PAECIP111802_07451 [Paenibacillus allorhizosphaerae]
MKLFTDEEKAQISDYGKQVIDYRRTGISLNHIIGCPLDCGYCVRHFWGNFEMKVPQLLCTDDEAVKLLLNHKYFVPNDTTVQFLHKATDPFLPAVKPHTFNVLKKLDDLGLENIVTFITRFIVTEEDMNFLESLRNIRVALFFTYSGIKDQKIEPIANSGITLNSIRTASKYKNKVKIIQYWRPIVAGWNDDDETIEHVLSISSLFDAIVYKGYRQREENKSYLKSKGVEIYDQMQYSKIVIEGIEERIMSKYKKLDIHTPIFKKTSCAISYVHSIADYNGNYGTKDLCHFCPDEQKRRCASSKKLPSLDSIKYSLKQHGYDANYKIEEDNIYISGLSKEDRYFMQHVLKYPLLEIN